MVFNKKDRLLGIDISPSGVKLVELSRSGKRYQIEAMAIEPLPEGAVEDSNPSDVDQIASALQRAVKASGTKLSKAAVAVPTSSVITRTIPMPVGYGEDEIEAAIEVEASQYIPFPLEEIYVDFSILGPSRASRDSQDVMIVASRRENVDLRQEVLQEAGLKAAVVDVEAYAIENMFSLLSSSLYFDNANTETAFERLNNIRTAIADIGLNTITLYIFQGTKVVFTREQPLGCDQLTRTIAEHYDLPKDRAELAKRTGELSEDYVPNILGPFRQSVADQINNGLQFFFSSSNYNSIDSLLLTGGGGIISDLDKVISQVLSVPCAVANPFESMGSVKKINRRSLSRDAPLFGVACGLALRSLD